MNSSPRSFTDQLWRAALLLLATAIVVSVAAGLLRSTWRPLLVVVGLLALLQLVITGWRRRGEW